MKKIGIFFILLILLGFNHVKALPINDKSKLNLTEIYQAVLIPKENAIEVLRSIIKLASDESRVISIKGTQHTQGGHSFSTQGLVVDLSNLNQMQMIADNVLRVQAGAHWKEVIEFLNNLGLSVAVMQSDYDFSVGGTVSTNVHGWRANKPPMIATIQGFHIMMADGQVRYCSRQENFDIFQSAIGGYGLLGIIIDVDLKVVKNHLYDLHQWVIDASDFTRFFKAHVQQNPKAMLFFGRFSLDHKNFLKQIIFRIYEDNDEIIRNTKISTHKWVEPIINWFFNRTYQNDWFRKLRWTLESSSFLSQFYEKLSQNQLLYHSVDNYMTKRDEQVDLLQEYFIPLNRFGDFVLFVQSLEPEIGNYLMNITIRHVQADQISILNYAPKEMICFVLYFRGPKTQAFDTKLKIAALKMTDRALARGGTYYLPYRAYQTDSQFKMAYRGYKKFKQIKMKYDPQGLFSNQFYQKYFHDREQNMRTPP
jgi:FAD/FMN-containing dehydrogenase